MGDPIRIILESGVDQQISPARIPPAWRTSVQGSPGFAAALCPWPSVQGLGFRDCGRTVQGLCKDHMMGCRGMKHVLHGCRQRLLIASPGKRQSCSLWRCSSSRSAYNSHFERCYFESRMKDKITNERSDRANNDDKNGGSEVKNGNHHCRRRSCCKPGHKLKKYMSSPTFCGLHPRRWYIGVYEPWRIKWKLQLKIRWNLLVSSDDNILYYIRIRRKDSKGPDKVLVISMQIPTAMGAPLSTKGNP